MKFTPTSRIDLGTETVRQFTTQYFSGNGRRIPVIGQKLSNRSVKILGIPENAWGCGFPFLDNVLAPTIIHGWGENDNSNQNWPVIPGGSYHNVYVAWRGAMPACPNYMPRSLENACADMHRVRDDSLCSMYHDLIRSPSKSCNPIRNLRVNRRGDDWEGPVSQQFLLQISVARVCKFSFLSVTTVSRYFWISCRIAFCVIIV